MAVQDTTRRQTLADAAGTRTIAPADAHQHGHEDNDHEHDDHDHEDGQDHRFELAEALRIGLVAIAAAAVWFRFWEPFSAISIIGVVGLLIGGWPILTEAFENILERGMTMELSMTIAIAAAAAIGEFETSSQLWPVSL
jgi:cation transport ATPase